MCITSKLAKTEFEKINKIGAKLWEAIISTLIEIQQKYFGFFSFSIWVNGSINMNKIKEYVPQVILEICRFIME